MLANTSQPQVAARLDTLPGAVQRINTLTVNVSNFLERFHGPQAEAQGAASPPEPLPCHAVHLDRLFGALDRLEGAVAALDHIG